MLSVFSKKASKSEKINFAFKLYDRDGEGELDAAELQQALEKIGARMGDRSRHAVLRLWGCGAVESRACNLLYHVLVHVLHARSRAAISHAPAGAARSKRNRGAPPFAVQAWHFRWMPSGT